MKTTFGFLVFASVWFFFAGTFKFVKSKPLLEQIRIEGWNVPDSKPTVKEMVLYVAGELGKVSVRLIPGTRIRRTRRKLDSAGHPLNMSVREFEGIKIIMSCALAIVFVLVSGSVLGGLFVGGTIGFTYPGFWLSEQIMQRKKAIARDLPFAIDLLAVAVDAGLGLDSAISRVVQKGKMGPLRDVLSDMLNDVRLGKSRDDALRCVADRVRVEELSSFVSTLLMADRFGTSVGQILRVLSQQTKLKRLQRAESIALKAPVKMVFPMVLFIFPTILIMLLAPVLLNNFLAS